MSSLLLNLRIREDLEYRLANILDGKDVALVGAGPSLSNVKEVRGDVIVSADGATNYLVERGIIPDVVVTDLDGLMSFPDSLYVVHAHGDNLPFHWKLDLMKSVIGTTQVYPFGRLKLYGGFTDGDRAFVLAKAFNARSIRLYAMDFDSDYIGMYSKPFLRCNVPMTHIKRRKLNIAKEIIHTLTRKDL
nr:6-hydroxymethylpterin diphosphokinase MptE-like protein [Metallosphaera javensis (ex Hofmann et al. 2022)]